MVGISRTYSEKKCGISRAFWLKYDQNYELSSKWQHGVQELILALHLPEKNPGKFRHMQINYNTYRLPLKCKQSIPTVK
jgi:hypothetical protein